MWVDAKKYLLKFAFQWRTAWPWRLMWIYCHKREMKPESCLVGGFLSVKKNKPGPAVWVTCDSWSFKYKGRWLERKKIDVQTWRVERSCNRRIKLEGASVSAGRVSWGHSSEYHTGMWNAESLPKQTHRPRHHHPQWLSSTALYTYAVIYVHEHKTNETDSQNQQFVYTTIIKATGLFRKFSRKFIL